MTDHQYLLKRLRECERILDKLTYHTIAGDIRDSITRIERQAAELEAAQETIKDLRMRWEAERSQNLSTISGGRYPDGSPAW